jgi:hypothetical protein
VEGHGGKGHTSDARIRGTGIDYSWWLRDLLSVMSPAKILVGTRAVCLDVTLFSALVAGDAGEGPSRIR